MRHLPCLSLLARLPSSLTQTFVSGSPHTPVSPQLLPTDKYLSFLPLAHIFETMVEHAILSVGGSIGFYNGNIKKILDDILTLKPTIFVGVPRVYQRFYDNIMAKVAALTGMRHCAPPSPALSTL